MIVFTNQKKKISMIMHDLTQSFDINDNNFQHRLDLCQVNSNKSKSWTSKIQI